MKINIQSDLAEYLNCEESYELDAVNIAEVIDFFKVNFDYVEIDIIADGEYIDSVESVLRFYKEIDVVPSFYGAGSSPLAKAVMGAVLIAGGVYVSAMSFGSASLIGGAMISMGIGLIVGAAMDVLFPVAVPKDDYGDDNNSPTYSWQGQVNTYTEGTPIPIIYGEMRVGGQIIFSRVDEVKTGTDVDASYLSVLLALSEGPIDYIGGIDEIYINNAPISNSFPLTSLGYTTVTGVTHSFPTWTVPAESQKYEDLNHYTSQYLRPCPEVIMYDADGTGYASWETPDSEYGDNWGESDFGLEGGHEGTDSNGDPY